MGNWQALNTSEMDLNTVACMYILGILESKDLPGIADKALLDGHYSISLCELATLKNPRMADAGDLFTEALWELDIPLPTEDQAKKHLSEYVFSEVQNGELDVLGVRDVGILNFDVAVQIAKLYARRIVDGDMEPYAGALQIATLDPIVKEAVHFEELVACFKVSDKSWERNRLVREMKQQASYLLERSSFSKGWSLL